MSPRRTGSSRRTASAERWTFYIDKEGVIKKIDKKVSTKTAGADLAKTIKELGLDK